MISAYNIKPNSLNAKKNGNDGKLVLLTFFPFSFELK